MVESRGDQYLDRVVDREVAGALASSPAVLIEGPRGCGKTWTGRRFARSEVVLDGSQATRLAAEVDPDSILEGSEPRLLDEWQLVRGIWNPMRHACDRRGGFGHFLLTGSQNPPDDITEHSGAGRVARVRMRPMSLWESGDAGPRSRTWPPAASSHRWLMCERFGRAGAGTGAQPPNCSTYSRAEVDGARGQPGAETWTNLVVSAPRWCQRWRVAVE